MPMPVRSPQRKRGHRLGDPCDQLLAIGCGPAIAQRDQRDHLAGDVVLGVVGADPGTHGPLVAIVVPLGVDAALTDQVVLPVDEHHAGLAGRDRRILTADERDHHREVLAEHERQPAVPVQRLPVPGAPRLVAQTQPVQLDHLVADGDRARRGDVLLVVRLRERLLGVGRRLGPIEVQRPAAVHRRDAAHLEADRARHHRVVAGRPAGGRPSRGAHRAGTPGRRS